jgi:hypothetical protein
MGVEKTTYHTLLFHSLCQAYLLLHVTLVLFLHVAKFASLSFSPSCLYPTSSETSWWESCQKVCNSSPALLGNLLKV